MPLWPRRSSEVALWPPPIGITDSSMSSFQNRFWGGRALPEGTYRADANGIYRLKPSRDPKDRDGAT